MERNLEKGSSALNGLIVIGVILVIMFSLPKEDRKFGLDVPGNSYSLISPGEVTSSSGYSRQSGVADGSTIQAAQESGRISIGSGNAAYSYQPYEEYISIENYGQSPVNLGGWQLKNGKDKRPYYQGGMLQRFSADVAVLPSLLLDAGERAIVTTGKPSVQTPYKIPEKFQENICTGYLEALPDYSFTPSLTLNCPRPSTEPGVENLDRECRDFLNTYPSCQTPKFEGKDLRGDSCETCLNGRRLSSVCAAFVKEHFSYQGCLANHSNDRSFNSRTWRVFLGRSWEMWADKYETIELYNSVGQLVDYENY